MEATRKSIISFPEIAIRELLANMTIHQDLQQRGTNPMVEVFKNRIEFSNAGAPLVAIERIVDSVPVSRWVVRQRDGKSIQADSKYN